MISWLIAHLLRREERNCFHHEQATGETWVEKLITDSGRHIIWVCRRCRRRWSI
jgi:hypothetical protein